MSRWRSPQAAAKRTERVQRELEQRGREKRKTWMLVVAFILVAVGLIAADFYWLRSQARQRHERRHQPRQKDTNNPAQTNQTGSTLSVRTNLNNEARP